MLADAVDLLSGRKPPEGAPSQKGDPLTDEQSINLIASLPMDGPGCRWTDRVGGLGCHVVQGGGEHQLCEASQPSSPVG